MKKLILIILLLGFFTGCSDDTLNPPSNSDKPTAMNTYCQATPDELMTRVIYTYYDGNLITEITYSYSVMESVKSFKYNSYNLLTEEIYKDDNSQIAITYIYNELNQLINIIKKTSYYDSNGNLSHESEAETPLEYENNQLVKQWDFFGGFHTYEYEYGKVVTLTEYTELGQKHHITTYKYSGDLKIEERKETAAGSLMYIWTFQYNSDDQLLTITEGENIIEQNDYNQKKLSEKKTYYFGIDPGFYFCNGNFIYRYKY